MSEHQTAEPGQDASPPPLGWPWSWVDPRRYASVPNIPEIVVLASTILSDIQTVMEGLLKRDEAVIPVYRYITTGLTNYGWFGGSAGYLKERVGYAVAVEASSSLQILFALFRLMANPSTFTSLKSIRQPALAQPLGLPLLPRRGESEFRWIGHPNIKAPTLTDDPELSVNLRLLHSYALTYLFLHEIGHVVEGHIEFCREAKYRALQMPRHEREELLRNELQPLEFLADQHALYAGALHILRYVWATPSIERKRESAVKHLTLYGIAAGIVSLIFEHYSGHSYSHPPASHRALYIRVAVHIDIPEFELSEDEIQEALNDGIEQAAVGWVALGWPRSQDVPRDIEGFLAPLMDVSSRCVSPQIPPGLQPNR